jgi:hypothetical protein
MRAIGERGRPLFPELLAFSFASLGAVAHPRIVLGAASKTPFTDGQALLLLHIDAQFRRPFPEKGNRPLHGDAQPNDRISALRQPPEFSVAFF